MSSGSKIFVSDVRRALTRPYRVTPPMIALVSLVPLYIFIAAGNRGRVLNAPAIGIDQLIPLSPGWSIIYGALYLFLILLPVMTICHAELIDRTVRAYLMIWLTAYAAFLVYPTIAPRPDGDFVPGTSFGAWGLRLLYDADPPMNCFPSLHVAHSFVGALAVWRLHARLGLIAVACAVIVGVSTLFTKQHYVLDVIGGLGLACAANALFLRGVVRDTVVEHERRAAVAVAMALAAIIAAMVGMAWLLFAAGAGPVSPRMV